MPILKISRSAVLSETYILSLWLMFPVLSILKPCKHCYNTWFRIYICLS